MSLLSVLTVLLSVTFLVYGLLCLTSLSMEREFSRFGLERLRTLTGWLEVLGGIGLLIGLKWPPALWVSAGGLALLMLCGVGVRISVSDGVVQILPAFCLMLVNLYVLVTALR